MRRPTTDLKYEGGLIPRSCCLWHRPASHNDIVTVMTLQPLSSRTPSVIPHADLCSCQEKQSHAKRRRERKKCPQASRAYGAYPIRQLLVLRFREYQIQQNRCTSCTHPELRVRPCVRAQAMTYCSNAMRRIQLLRRAGGQGISGIDFCSSPIEAY